MQQRWLKQLCRDSRRQRLPSSSSSCFSSLRGGGGEREGMVRGRKIVKPGMCVCVCVIQNKKKDRIFKSGYTVCVKVSGMRRGGYSSSLWINQRSNRMIITTRTLSVHKRKNTNTLILCLPLMKMEQKLKWFHKVGHFIIF